MGHPKIDTLLELFEIDGGVSAGAMVSSGAPIASFNSSSMKRGMKRGMKKLLIKDKSPGEMYDNIKKD